MPPPPPGRMSSPYAFPCPPPRINIYSYKILYVRASVEPGPRAGAPEQNAAAAGLGGGSGGQRGFSAVCFFFVSLAGSDRDRRAQFTVLRDCASLILYRRVCTQITGPVTFFFSPAPPRGFSSDGVVCRFPGRRRRCRRLVYKVITTNSLRTDILHKCNYIIILMKRESLIV